MTGSWTLRAGASVDNGLTWVYSSDAPVAVSNAISSYALATMAVPGAGSSLWYSPSSIAQKTYQVQHLNP